MESGLGFCPSELGESVQKVLRTSFLSHLSEIIAVYRGNFVFPIYIYFFNSHLLESFRYPFEALLLQTQAPTKLLLYIKSYKLEIILS